MTKKGWKRLYLLMLTVTIGLMIGGCLGLYQPKAYVEVTRPPMRVIYLDYHNDISTKDVNQIMKNMDNIEYHPYRFNDKYGITIDYDAGLTTDHSKTVTINKEENK